MPPDPRTDETRQLEHVRQDLRREFASLPPAQVDAAFWRVVSAYTRAPVRSFVAVLAQRDARQILRSSGAR